MACHVERHEGSSAQHIGSIKRMWFSCDHKGCEKVAEDYEITHARGLLGMGWGASGGKHYCPEHAQVEVKNG